MIGEKIMMKQTSVYMNDETFKEVKECGCTMRGLIQLGIKKLKEEKDVNTFQNQYTKDLERINSNIREILFIQRNSMQDIIDMKKEISIIKNKGETNVVRKD